VRKVEGRCILCNRRREGGSEYCVYHYRAYSMLRDSFERWSRALSIDWVEFLREVIKNSETGEWAREVAENLLGAGLP
jgi:hypothetical protein